MTCMSLGEHGTHSKGASSSMGAAVLIAGTDTVSSGIAWKDWNIDSGSSHTEPAKTMGAVSVGIGDTSEVDLRGERVSLRYGDGGSLT